MPHIHDATRQIPFITRVIPLPALWKKIILDVLLVS